MTLVISLPSDAETKLKERALAAGKEVSDYARQLLVNELAAPVSLSEAAEPLAKAVDASGVTDDELTSVLVDSLDAARRERHRKPA
jgi:hypothetical protein